MKMYTTTRLSLSHGVRLLPAGSGTTSNANRLPLPLIACAAIAFCVLTSIAHAGDPIPLRAGPVSMIFDADNVFLRYLRVGPHEVLRGINAPVRDQNWATVAPKVSNLQVETHLDHFKVTFDVRCADHEVDFRWNGSITGNADGVVEFRFDGMAHSTFKRNRIGFCVLHGPAAAGQPWLIETVDGEITEGRFPELVSPHQPAKNIRAITHQVTPGIQAHVTLEGEVFEMEDQRNWTDASFKTYCTPLEIPYPVEIRKGTKISQKITISIDGDPGELASGGPGAVLTLGERESPLPELGLQVSGEVENLTDSQLERLQKLHLDHLRIDLALSDTSFVKDLRRATEQAVALGVSLHIGLNLGETPAFATLLSEVATLQPPVSYWLVTGGNPAHFQEARKQLAPLVAEGRVGVTRMTNFVDLNRERPNNSTVEAIGFAINPQIHAFDNASMVETLPIHATVVHTARQFAGDRPLLIGPVTLRPQLVNGEDPPGGPPAGSFPTYVDTRQGTEFTAVWTLGSLKYLTEAGAHSATYYETVGWNGIMDADDVRSRPAAWPSQPGENFPVYHVLREIGEFADGQVLQVNSSSDLEAVGLALRKPGQLRVLVGNLTGEPQTISVRGLGVPVAVRLLNGEQISTTPEIQIPLPPYGIARIDRAAD